ncbi:hydrogenase maturation nickel metallochaperone HypA [Pontiellaceae bacterium B12227]|nr:hydrogenase maturation nickel metallochaperone HypA [Pontiellaceae bacterium B12227]
MHELSLATEIIELARPHIPKGEMLKVVGLIVGPLAGVCEESLRFCFAELVRLEGFPEAMLQIESAPARFQCLDCGHEYETVTVEQFCPACSSMARTMLSGTEFSINFIEV